MKKVINLTESDLSRIVNRVIMESEKKIHLTKITSKIKEILSDLGYSEFREDFSVNHIKNINDDGYSFKVIIFDEDDLDINKVIKKVMNGLGNEFGEKYFKLDRIFRRHFIFSLDKNA
jgi:hypothetical protein